MYVVFYGKVPLCVCFRQFFCDLETRYTADVSWSDQMGLHLRPWRPWKKKRKKKQKKRKSERPTAKHKKKRSPIFFATHTKKKKKKKKGERWAEQIKKKEQQYPTDRRLKEAHNGLRSPIILLDIDSNLFEYSDNAAWNRSISIVNRRPNNNDVPFEPLFNIGFPISTTISVTDLFFD